MQELHRKCPFPQKIHFIYLYASRVGHKSMGKKTSVRNLQYEPKPRLIRGMYLHKLLTPDYYNHEKITAKRIQ